MGMSGMRHGMGSMSMGDGLPSHFYLQKVYWVVVGTSMGWATCVNVYNQMLYRQRYLSISAVLGPTA